jgi:hypothetical protein
VVINTSIYTPERADALVLMAYLAKFGGLPLGAQRTDEPTSILCSRPLEELAATD